MDYIIDGIRGALGIIFSLESEFLTIVSTSIRISLASTALASILAIPFGLWVGTGRFKGRNFVATVLNTLMSLPTVVIGLLVYSLLSRRGPAGGAGILFTPAAMITGQCILAFPLIAAFVAGGARSMGDEALVASRTLGAGRFQSGLLFLREAEPVIITSVLAGFGRVFSEVGISMMLGGNIRFYTRNITTAIALETSRGAFSLGIALGIVLMVIAFFVNAVVYNFKVKRL
jgi:tungstate transport system permease protein